MGTAGVYQFDWSSIRLPLGGGWGTGNGGGNRVHAVRRLSGARAVPGRLGARPV